MTLPELLEELKAVDPDTAEDIGNVVNVISIKSDGSFTLDAYYPDFIIQGCVQRACEKRGWPLVLSFDCDPDHPQTWVAEICDSKGALLGIEQVRMSTFFDPEFDKFGAGNLDGILMTKFKHPRPPPG